MARRTNSQNQFIEVPAKPWTGATLIVMVLAFSFRPLTNSDLWWQLSRGRAVVDGQIAPSRFLLAGDLLSEADWLGGVPFYLTHLLGGVFGLTIIKLATTAGLAIWCWRRGQYLPSSTRLIITASLIIAAQAACGPTNSLWDVMGLITASHLLSESRSESILRRSLTIGALACGWSNLAPLSILILLPWMEELLHRFELTTDRRAISNHSILGAAAVIGCCLTPRGPLGLWDSARLLAPWILETRAVLSQTDWQPLWCIPIDGLVVGWVLLSLLTVIGLVQSGISCRSEWLMFMIVQGIGIVSAPTAIVLASWLVFQAITVWERIAIKSHDRQTSGLSIWGLRLTCLNIGVMAAVGVWPFSESRLGWGICRKLEDRELAAVLGTNVGDGTAHCPDVLAAGALSWSEVLHVKPFLVPHRALLNGVLRDEVLLTRELESGWLQRHQRTDGTLGGWWLSLQSRRTVLILVTNERTAMIRSLEPTLWKPLSLDSPVIPFAMAGDPQLTPQIIRVLEQRELVDRGAWQFQVPETAGHDRLLDGIGLLTGWVETGVVLRQAAALRAMNLPQAAVRVLRPILQIWSFNGQIHDELLACQLDLVERKQITSGQIDEFRQAVLNQLDPSGRHQVPALPGASNVTRPHHTSPLWRQAVERYLQGEPKAAAELLQGDDPAIMSARASLIWEAGFPADAREIWAALAQRFPDSRHALIGRHALDSADY